MAALDSLPPPGLWLPALQLLPARRALAGRTVGVVGHQRPAGLQPDPGRRLDRGDAGRLRAGEAPAAGAGGPAGGHAVGLCLAPPARSVEPGQPVPDDRRGLRPLAGPGHPPDRPAAVAAARGRHRAPPRRDSALPPAHRRPQRPVRRAGDRLPGTGPGPYPAAPGARPPIRTGRRAAAGGRPGRDLPAADGGRTALRLRRDEQRRGLPGRQFSPALGLLHPAAPAGRDRHAPGHRADAGPRPRPAGPGRADRLTCAAALRAGGAAGAGDRGHAAAGPGDQYPALAERALHVPTALPVAQPVRGRAVRGAGRWRGAAPAPGALADGGPADRAARRAGRGAALDLPRPRIPALGPAHRRGRNSSGAGRSPVGPVILRRVPAGVGGLGAAGRAGRRRLRGGPAADRPLQPRPDTGISRPASRATRQHDRPRDADCAASGALPAVLLPRLDGHPGWPADGGVSGGRDRL